MQSVGSIPGVKVGSRVAVTAGILIRSPCTERPRSWVMGSQTVGHDWAINNAAAQHWGRAGTPDQMVSSFTDCRLGASY